MIFASIAAHLKAYTRRSAEMPLPLHAVLGEEMAPVARKPSEEKHQSSVVPEDHVLKEHINWEDFEAKWRLCGMEKLCEEVRSGRVHPLRDAVADYLQSLAFSVSQGYLLFRLKTRVWPKKRKKLRKEERLPVKGQISVALKDERIRQLKLLINSPKCLFEFRYFPKRKLSQATKCLVHSFIRDRRPTDNEGQTEQRS